MPDIPPALPPAAQRIVLPVTNLVPGQKVEALLMRSDRHGMQVQIGQRDFRLLDLPAQAPGTRLTLQVVAAHPREPLQVRLLAVDGQPTRLTPTGALMARSAASTAVPVVEPPAPVARALEMPAQIINHLGKPVGAPFQVAVALAPPGVSQPMDADAKMMSAAPSPGQTVPPPAAPAGAGGQQLAKMAALPGPPIAPPPAAQGVAGHEDGPLEGSQRHLPAPVAQAQPLKAATELSLKIASMTTEVVARSVEGRVTVSDGKTLLRLEQPLDLPLGARLQIALQAGDSAIDAALPTLEADPVEQLTRALEELESGDGRGTGDPLAGKGLVLPRADSNLAARLLHLLEAIAQLPGDSLAKGEGLDPETLDPLGRATGALEEIRRQGNEPLLDDWRMTPLPMGPNPGDQIVMFHRSWIPDEDTQGGDQDRGEQDPAERAVFEVAFSHLGRCQLDAFCQGRRFDLLVRSERPLEPAVIETISGLFAASLEIAGISGQLAFRAGEFASLAKRPAVGTVINV